MVRGCLPEHSTVAQETRNLDAARRIRCHDGALRTSLTVPVQVNDHRQDLMLLIL